MMIWGTSNATLAIANGVNVKTLASMLGHHSEGFTLDTYTHVTNDMQRAAAANIDRGIGKAAPQETASAPGQEPPGHSGKAEDDRFQALCGP